MSSVIKSVSIFSDITIAVQIGSILNKTYLHKLKLKYISSYLHIAWNIGP